MSESRVWAAVCAGLGALAWLPSRVGMPSAALDTSWGVVLHEAARQSWQFGTDIVFTYGPLGYLAVPTFAPDIFWSMVGFHVAVGAACGWAFHAIVRGAGWPGWAGPLAMLAWLPPTLASSDLPFLVPVVLWMFLGLQTTRARLEPALLALSAVVGAVALVKFTTFLLATALAAVLGIDDLLRRRRAPVPSLICLASVLVLWLLSGQHVTGLTAWLQTSYETSAAYSEAMSTPVGPYQRRELLLFAVNVVALLALAAWGTVRDRGLRASVAPLLGLLLVVFVHFKLGFVRHDAHATVAMFAMPMLGVLVAADGVARADQRRFRAFAAVVIMLGLASYSYGLRRYFDRLAPPEHYRASYALQIGTVLDFARPGRLLQRLTRERETALERLRGDLPLPPSRGSFDLYGHQQGLLLAHAVTYAPRPIFQSYGAYTEGLAALNRRSLEGTRGPHDVLFDVTTIDHRYPLMDDGASLPVLLTRFDVKGMVGAFAHLQRRQVPRTATLSPLASVSTMPGDTVAVDAGGDNVWAEVEIDLSLPGRVTAMLYKVPPVYLEVTTADGAVRPHRVVRPLVRGGMLLSPLVRSADEFVRLAGGEFPAPGQQVTAVRVRVDWPFAYATPVHLRLFRLTVRP